MCEAASLMSASLRGGGVVRVAVRAVRVWVGVVWWVRVWWVCR
jgi:hypothetical protein